MSSSFLLPIGLIALASLAHLIGLVWILVHAFKVSTRWGVLLLAPYILALSLQVVRMPVLGAVAGFAAFCTCIVFIVKHWQRSKGPFILLLSSWVVIVLGFAGLGLAVGNSAMGKELAAQMASTPQFDPGKVPTPSLPAEPNHPRMSKARSEQPHQINTVAASNASSPAQLPAKSAESAETPSKAAEVALPASGQNLSEKSAPTASREWDPRQLPLALHCDSAPYDSGQSVQFVTLCMSNSSPKAIQCLKLRLVYFDGKGGKLKEWTTQRELDRALEPGGTLKLSHPAYFMPSTAWRTTVVPKSVGFADGTEWVP